MERKDITEYLNYRLSNNSYTERDMYMIKRYILLIEKIDVDYHSIVATVRTYAMQRRISKPMTNMMKHMMDHFKIHEFMNDKKQIIKFF